MSHRTAITGRLPAIPKAVPVVPEVWESQYINDRLPITIMGKVASAPGVHAWDVVAKVHSHDIAEKRRRARLIAAAPAMLEALEAFDALYLENPDDLENMDKAAAAIRAAILKAKG
jgi:hypothetical protein